MANDLPQRKPIRWDKRDYSAEGAYFITICTKDRRKILSRIVGAIHESPAVELTEIGMIVKKHNWENGLSFWHRDRSIRHYAKPYSSDRRNRRFRTGDSWIAPTQEIDHIKSSRLYENERIKANKGNESELLLVATIFLRPRDPWSGRSFKSQKIYLGKSCPLVWWRIVCRIKPQAK